MLNAHAQVYCTSVKGHYWSSYDLFVLRTIAPRLLKAQYDIAFSLHSTDDLYILSYVFEAFVGYAILTSHAEFIA